MGNMTRTRSAQIAVHWIAVALGDYWIAEVIRLRLIHEAFVFLLMGFDTTELRVWRQGNIIEVIPAMLAGENEGGLRKPACT